MPMKELVRLLSGTGLQQVKTYIQTGNIIFRSEAAAAGLTDQIQAEIEKEFGFTPYVLVHSFEELQKAVVLNPFPEAETEPKTLHLYFLAAAPEQPDLTSLVKAKKESEQFKLLNKIFYLYTPEGLGRSKLAARVEKALGTAATARNWRTIGKIQKLAEQMDTNSADPC